MNVLAKIIAENVKKSFGDVKALDGVTITVEDGAFVVLLGPSGCGKTTFMRCISGLEELTDGKIYFDDREVSGLQPKDRNVAMVFQSYAVWPHMKVRENIAYPLKLKKFSKEEIEEKVKWAADLLNISELLNRYPSQLSGGQRQRVAVARAIVHRPEVLLMDEPLSNLDALLRVKMRSELKKLHEQLKVTTIYVTHDQVEAMTMGDKIAVMNSGRIIQYGTPEEIYKKPATAFVAGFIGSPQMNFFKCDVVEEDGQQFAKFEHFRFKIPTRINNKTVIVGIRPENVSLEMPKGRDSIGLEVTVYFIERLMPETILHLDVGNGKSRMTAKLPNDVVLPEGKKIEVFVSTESLHFFDAETEERIL